jgi:TRAP-type mannitol/chloroaromatic compound transport system permease small subunit
VLFPFAVTQYQLDFRGKAMEDIESGQTSGAGAGTMTFAIWALIWVAALVLLLRP